MHQASNGIASGPLSILWLQVANSVSLTPTMSHQPQDNWLGLRHGAGRRSIRRCLSTEIRLLHLHLHLPTKERLTLVNHVVAEDPPPSRLMVTRARKLLSQLPI